MLAVLLLVPVVATVLMRGPTPSAPVAASIPAPGPTVTDQPKERVGPWGRMIVTPVTIQPPIRLIPPALYSSRPVQWEIGGAGEAELSQLLADAGVEPSPRDQIIASHRELPRGKTQLRIDPALIRDFPPETRGRLYRALLRLDWRNREIFGTKRWSPDQWADIRAKLPPAVGDLVAGFLFPALDGPDVHFWDVGAVLHFLPEETDRIALTRALNHQRTFLISLAISPDAPVGDIAAYWRLASTRRQIIPMLESLAALPGTSRIDALHLMPSFVREHAYTYPVSTLTRGQGESLDCFWTCANFDRKLGEPAIPSADAATYLTSHYATYVGRPEFGDIIVLRDAEENALHAAVHVADDIVFTKNGKHPLMPWVFMELDEMIRIYELADPQKTLWVRRATD
ncbi:MAG: hypothetical protein ABII82_15285 [Verrucomicrobiota bacterium]